MRTAWKYILGAASAALILPASALAHPFHLGVVPGISAGFLHPLSGLDHILAMLAVGYWAARIGGAWQWRMPTLFLGAAGFAFLLPTLLSVALPTVAVETGLAASLLFLGGLIALDLHERPAVGAALVASFGLFHGLAHGVEATPGLSPLLFMAGFLAATALLHGLGLTLGRLAVHPVWARLGGAGVAAAGAALLVLPA